MPYIGASASDIAFTRDLHQSTCFEPLPFDGTEIKCLMEPKVYDEKTKVQYVIVEAAKTD